MEEKSPLGVHLDANEQGTTMRMAPQYRKSRDGTLSVQRGSPIRQARHLGVPKRENEMWDNGDLELGRTRRPHMDNGRGRVGGRHGGFLWSPTAAHEMVMFKLRLYSCENGESFVTLAQTNQSKHP